MNLIIKIVLLLLSQTVVVFSQRTETAINFSDKIGRLVLEIENDLLFQSDNYYTAGIAVSYSNKKLKNTPAQFILSRLISKDLDVVGVGVQQRIFTPYSIKEENTVDNDRPYSAYILLTNYSVFVNKQKRLVLSNELGIGILGPVAGGQEVQTFIHKLIGSTIPIGWNHQLNNAFLLDYWFRVEKSFFSGFIAEHFIPYAEARIGTLTDRVKLGMKIRIGNKNKLILKLANKKTVSKSFIWEWVFAANLQGVFYDATLEGGLFNRDESIALPMQDVIEQQYQVRTGFNIYIKRFSFRYMVNFNSSDFANAVVHRYGSVNFGYAI